MNSKRTPWHWFAALRPFSFPAALLPLLIATAAAAPARQWKLPLLAAEALAVVLMLGFGNLLNDYFDFRHGADTRFNEDEGRPGRYLVTGFFQASEYLLFALTLLALLVPLSAYLVWSGGPLVAALTAFGVAGAYAYTGDPFQLKSRGLGEIWIFLVFGPGIAVVASSLQTRQIAPAAIYVSVPAGMLVSAILASNNLRDIEEDSAGGMRTAAVRLGTLTYRWIAVGLFLLPPLLVLIMTIARILTPWSLLCWLSLPLAISPVRDAIHLIRRPNADVLTAKYQTAFSTLLFTGLLIPEFGP